MLALALRQAPRWARGGRVPVPGLQGKGDWGQEEKGKTEDEMAGWHH